MRAGYHPRHSKNPSSFFRCCKPADEQSTEMLLLPSNGAFLFAPTAAYRKKHRFRAFAREKREDVCVPPQTPPEEARPRSLLRQFARAPRDVVQVGPDTDDLGVARCSQLATNVEGRRRPVRRRGTSAAVMGHAYSLRTLQTNHALTTIMKTSHHVVCLPWVCCASLRRGAGTLR